MATVIIKDAKVCDVVFTRSGGIIGIEGLTNAGREWIADHVDAPANHSPGDVIWAEPRYARDICDAMLADGLHVS